MHLVSADLRTVCRFTQAVILPGLALEEGRLRHLEGVRTGEGVLMAACLMAAVALLHTLTPDGSGRGTHYGGADFSVIEGSRGAMVGGCRAGGAPRNIPSWSRGVLMFLRHTHPRVVTHPLRALVSHGWWFVGPFAIGPPIVCLLAQGS